MLDVEEMERLSDCMEVVEGNGNIINSEFQINSTGKLVTEIDIPASQLSCQESSSILYLAIPIASQARAVNFCNKIDIDSMGPLLEKPEDYVEFHNTLRKLPAYRSRC